MMKQVNFRIPCRVAALILGLFLSVGAFAQNITVTGHVKDATGEAIIGASVKVVGSNTGTITDFDGNFTLSTKKGAQLAVSYIGYTTQNVTASPNVVVTLEEDSKVLKEVVAIGYGRARKSDLTGSVTAIKPDEINHGLQTTPQDMLQGKIAGVSVITSNGEPGAGAQIRVRGGSSLNATNDPLIVIDGLAMDNYGIQGMSNPLSMVNPNDIESFSVLKDASATAIYGSRASNGVIIITTKKGRSGQKAKISYNGTFTFSVKKNTLDVMDGPAYVNFIKNLYGEDSNAYKTLGWYDNNGVQHIENTNWQNAIYRTALSQDHNVTITGGLKNMPYRASFGLTDQPGIVKTSSFQRYTASVNLSPSLLNDHLNFNINGKGMYAKNRRADNNAIGASVWFDPTKPVLADADIYNKFFGGYYQWSQATTDLNDSYWNYTSMKNGTTNPVALLELKDDRTISKTFVGNVEADYKIHGFEDLHIHANGGIDYTTSKETNTESPYSKGNNYYGWDGWNSMKTYNLSFNAYAQYVKDLNKANHIDIMAGYEWQHFHKFTNWDGYGMYPSTNLSTPNQKYNVQNTEKRYKTENYLVSFFGRLNYSLLDRYLITLTLRDDGSSRFSKDNRWGLFPSAAFAWRLKEESFLRNSDVVSDAKIRLGWGITGQQEGIADYSYIPTYVQSNARALYNLLGDGGTTYRPDAYNTDLKWEKTTTYNAGLDLNFLNDRLQFNFDYYYRKTTDLLNEVYISAGTQFKNRQLRNIGSLHNTGFEFATTIRPIQTKDWRWEVNYNFTYNKNKIDNLVNSNQENYYVEAGDNISVGTGGKVEAYAEGHAVNAFHVYQQVYDKNGKPVQGAYVDRNGDGIINESDLYYYYKPAADVLMGFASKLQYKNWDFSFTLRASLGNYVFNSVEAGSANISKASVFYGNQYLANRLVSSTNLGWYNTAGDHDAYSDYFVQNASFLKCDNITLGYNFPTIFGDKISGRVYATVQNVFTITNYTGLDPEVANGIDNNMYPRPFSTIIGLNLNF